MSRRAPAVVESGRPYTVERTGPTVTTLRLSVPRSQSWSRWFLLRSDAHHDNRHSRHDMELKHLRMARERDAGIIDVGDLFCAMQGKWDKRSDQDQLRPEHRGNNYLDRLVSTAADFYAPFADLFVQLSPGNHETAILRHHQTDLTERLVERLRASELGKKVAGHAPVQRGVYAGWVRFVFRIGREQRCSVRLRYIHGYGGGGPVTKDVIQAQRQAAILGNADIIVSGHTHDAWELPHVREFLNHNGRPALRELMALKLGGYKDEYSSGEGYHVESGRGPKPLGAYFVRFYFEDGEIRYGAERAK